MKFYILFGFSAAITVICLFASIYGAAHGISGMGPGYGVMTFFGFGATVLTHMDIDL